MLYLYRQLRCSPIYSQAPYVIFLFNTSDISSRTNQTWVPCAILAQIKLPLRTYAKTRLYYKYYLEGKKPPQPNFKPFLIRLLVASATRV